MLPMKQTRLCFGNLTKRMRKREFMAQMECIVPWAALVEVVAPFAHEGRRCCPAGLGGHDAAHPLHAAVVHA